MKGNVGIGTETPSNELSVVGDADFSGNVGIGTTTPDSELEVAGDAKVTGNLIVNGDITTTTKTRYLSIAPAGGFIPKSSGIQWDMIGGAIYGSSIGQNVEFYASVELPQDSIIKAIHVRLYDVDPTFDMTIKCGYITEGSLGSLALFSSSGTPGLTTLSQNLINPYQVDNLYESYYVGASWITPSPQNRIHLRGVTIEYEINEF